MTPEEFQKKYGGAWRKWLKTELGQALLLVCDSQQPIRRMADTLASSREQNEQLHNVSAGYEQLHRLIRDRLAEMPQTSIPDATYDKSED